MSGELNNNEWLIRELESYECSENWAACSDLAMRAATALHLAEDVVEAKDAEIDRLRSLIVQFVTVDDACERHSSSIREWVQALHALKEEARRASMTGAEQYFAARLANPEYRQAYEEARRER